MEQLENGWTHLRTEKGPDIGILQLDYEHLNNPRNGKDIRVGVFKGRDAVNVIAITPEGDMLLVRQLRFGTMEWSVEPPGGLMNVGEDRLAAIQRELQEETGYTGTTWSYLCSFASQPVFMDNHIHTFVVTDAQLTAPRDLDDEEDIELLHVPIEQVKQWLRDGVFVHPHAISSITQFLLRYGYMG